MSLTGKEDHISVQGRKNLKVQISLTDLLTGLIENTNSVKCCFDNHIGSCVPGSSDDETCDDICKINCIKGGHCKVIGNEPPNHFCHCLC
ncbi:hypothetical protein AAZX31_08G073400 [Glycine max]